MIGINWSVLGLGAFNVMTFCSPRSYTSGLDLTSFIVFLPTSPHPLELDPHRGLVPAQGFDPVYEFVQNCHMGSRMT